MQPISSPRASRAAPALYILLRSSFHPVLTILLTPALERWSPARDACASALPYVEGAICGFVRLTDRLFRLLPDQVVHSAFVFTGAQEKGGLFQRACASRGDNRLASLTTVDPEAVSRVPEMGGRVERGWSFLDQQKDDAERGWSFLDQQEEDGRRLIPVTPAKVRGWEAGGTWSGRLGEPGRA